MKETLIRVFWVTVSIALGVVITCIVLEESFNCYAKTPFDCLEIHPQGSLLGEIWYNETEEQFYIYRGWVKLDESSLDEILMDGNGKFFRLRYEEIGDIENGLYEGRETKGSKEMRDSVK